jgi:hypothetical protein
MSHLIIPRRRLIKPDAPKLAPFNRRKFLKAAAASVIASPAIIRSSQAAFFQGAINGAVTFPDGFTNAPTGTAQFPTLLSGYAVRPPWHVPGVDYRTGISTGVSLVDPATLNNGTTIVYTANASGNTLEVNASNITINGADFSLNGGTQLVLGDHVAISNILITNCKFSVSSSFTALQMVNQVSATGVTYSYCEFDGDFLVNNWSLGPAIDIKNGGSATLSYCYFHDFAGDFVDIGSGTYLFEFCAEGTNGLSSTSHPDWLELGSGNYNVTVSFCTNNQNAQPPQVKGSLGWGLSPFPLTSGVVNATVNNNTFVATAGAQVTYFVSGGTSTTITLSQNYCDPTGGSGTNPVTFFSSSGSSSTETGNINMVTGAPIT